MPKIHVDDEIKVEEFINTELPTEHFTLGLQLFGVIRYLTLEQAQGLADALNWQITVHKMSKLMRDSEQQLIYLKCTKCDRLFHYRLRDNGQIYTLEQEFICPMCENAAAQPTPA